MTTKQKGIFYGYPKCCIDSFIQIKINKRTSAQRLVQRKSVVSGTGYIPCHECSVKILNNETTIESLIINRLSRNKFPKGSRLRRCRLLKLV